MSSANDPLAQDIMTYIAATFDAATDASMRATADRIGAGSDFLPETLFHVPIFGSLHSYHSDVIAAACASAPALRGKFVKWELHRQELRCVVELDGDAELLAHFQSTMPRGKPWRTVSMTLGSVAAIEEWMHDDFVTAVSQNFPVDSSFHFTFAACCQCVTPAAAQHHHAASDVNGAVSAQTAADAKKTAHPDARPAAAPKVKDKKPTNATKQPAARLNPKARPFVPGARTVTIAGRHDAAGPIKNYDKNIKKPTTRHRRRKSATERKASPHLKWERPGAQVTSDIDMLIKGHNSR